MQYLPGNKIKVGDKSLVRSPGQIEVMSSGEWSLHMASVSPCGEWQNYKLYRDVARAPKNVFYLTIKVGSEKFHRTHDLLVLEDSYEGMDDWAMSAIRGVRKEPPDFTAKNGWQRDAPKYTDYSGNIAITQGFINSIRLAWEEGWPLSPYAQTRKVGRYAIKILADLTGLKHGDVELTLDRMLEKQMITYRRMKARGGKMSGLAPIEIVDPEEFPKKFVPSGLSAEQIERRYNPDENDVKILSLIRDRWERGQPLSFFSQTRRQGRYAPWVMVLEFEMDEMLATRTIARLLKSGAIAHQVVDKSTKLRGLRVMEASNG